MQAINRGNLEQFKRSAENIAGNQVLIHCAGLAHQASNVSHAQLIMANATFPTQLATIASQAKFRVFVLVSSAKVMGDNSAQGLRETDDCQPIGSYAQSKLEGEIRVSAALKNSQTRLIIVRPPLVYGPEVSANFLQLLKLAQTGFPLPLLGATGQRSMIYIENLMSIVLKLIENPLAQGTYFVSDNEALSTSEWIKRLRRQFQVSNRQFYFPPHILSLLSSAIGQRSKFDRLFDPFLLDTEKLNALGINAPFTLAQSIGATADWFTSDAKNQ